LILCLLSIHAPDFALTFSTLFKFTTRRPCHHSNGHFNEVYGTDPDGMAHIASLSDVSMIGSVHPRLLPTVAEARGYTTCLSLPPQLRLCVFADEPTALRFKGDHSGFFLDFCTNKSLWDHYAKARPTSVQKCAFQRSNKLRSLCRGKIQVSAGS
jgi:hypothetical protein